VATKNIEYLFWKGKFCEILFLGEGFLEFGQLRESVSKEFGEGKNRSPIKNIIFGKAKEY